VRNGTGSGVAAFSADPGGVGGRAVADFDARFLSCSSRLAACSMVLTFDSPGSAARSPANPGRIDQQACYTASKAKFAWRFF
jgi:hypothetical protein